jgi:hypothetical protein
MIKAYFYKKCKNPADRVWPVRVCLPLKTVYFRPSTHHVIETGPCWPSHLPARTAPLAKVRRLEACG